MQQTVLPSQLIASRRLIVSQLTALSFVMDEQAHHGLPGNQLAAEAGAIGQRALGESGLLPNSGETSNRSDRSVRSDGPDRSDRSNRSDRSPFHDPLVFFFLGMFMSGKR